MRLQFEGMPATIAARITPPALQASDLAGYAGTFYSPELDVTWQIVVHEGGLFELSAARMRGIRFQAQSGAMQAGK
jgi:hypothetical protein